MNKTAALALVVLFATLPAAAAPNGKNHEGLVAGNGKIVFSQDAAIMQLDLKGRGPAQKIGRGFDPAWSPDGRTLALTDLISPTAQTLFVMDADGRNRRRLPIAAGGKWDVSNYSPAWSPDGTRLAFTRSTLKTNTDSNWRIDVYVVDLDGRNLRRLTSSGAAYGPTWSPDGRRIAYLGVVGRVVGSSDVSHRLHVVNADGSGDHTLVAASRATWAPRGHAFIWPPAWSGDGRRIAFSRATRSPATEPDWAAFEIYVINPDGTGLRRLTRTTVKRPPPLFAENIWPAWSPDGKQIVFISLPNSVQVMNADGSGLRTMFRSRPIGRFGGVSWQPVP
jgi:Tol biopolymer transport system component